MHCGVSAEDEAVLVALAVSNPNVAKSLHDVLWKAPKAVHPKGLRSQQLIMEHD